MENHPLVFIKSSYKETNFVHLLLAVHIMVCFALHVQISSSSYKLAF